VEEILEKNVPILPANPSLAVHEIPFLNSHVGIADFEPVEDEQLGISFYFEIFAKFFIDTLGERNVQHSQLVWLFHSLLCQVVDHLNIKSYVQLAMDGQPLGVLLIKGPRPGEKINTNEPVEIWFRSTDRLDSLEHVLPLEIQSTATRYFRTNVKRPNPKTSTIDVTKTSVHNVGEHRFFSRVSGKQGN